MIEFQSAHPVRGATITPSMFTLVSAYFNPRAPCGARPVFHTHDPYHDTDFNPRAPCGARLKADTWYRLVDGFQSTRPVWGATCFAALSEIFAVHFNPRAPCGARPSSCPFRQGRIQISIHAPRVGRDQIATVAVLPVFISIHAPRVGRDLGQQKRAVDQQDFNPRAPCGARHKCDKRDRDDYHYFNPRAPCGARQPLPFLEFLRVQFQSTRPVWGATPRPARYSARKAFQSTRPVWGATFTASAAFVFAAVFQSTRPVWGATLILCMDQLHCRTFQSTRPVWGATL